MTTRDVYDRLAGDYLRRVAEADPVGLADFIRAMPTGGAVLDLGCGPGHHAARMAEAGLDVVAADASPAMCELAAEQGDFTVIEATFDDIPDLGQFDGIWASFSLLHAPRADLPRHLAALRGALVPGGLLTLGMKTGSGEGPDRLGRFYAYWSEAELRAALRDADLAPGLARNGSDRSLTGDVEPWIVLDAYG